MNWFQRTFEIFHSGRRAIHSIEGLRGFAVFLVFMVHYTTLIEPWILSGSFTYNVAGKFRGIGYAGVDIFFVISGYLIYGMLINNSAPFLSYLRKRIRRIYPTFLTVLFIYLILSFVFSVESKLPRSRISAIVYVLQNIFLLPGLFNIAPIITVAWSLSYEFFYYLTIPAIIYLLSLRLWNYLMRIFFFLGMLIAGFVYLYLHSPRLVDLLMFIPGIIVYEILDHHSVKFPSTIEVFSLIATLGVMIMVHGWLRFVLLFIFLSILCLAVFSQRGFMAKLFLLPPVRWYGNMSYSYFLIHGLTLKALFLFVGYIFVPANDNIVLFWVLLVPAFLITLIPSAILFILIEKPFSLTFKTHPQPSGISPSDRPSKGLQ